MTALVHYKIGLELSEETCRTEYDEHSVSDHKTKNSHYKTCMP